MQFVKISLTPSLLACSVGLRTFFVMQWMGSGTLLMQLEFIRLTKLYDYDLWCQGCKFRCVASRF